MTVASFLSHLARIKRQSQPPVIINITVFAPDDHVPVRIMGGSA
jgi:hypothetical protein